MAFSFVGDIQRALSLLKALEGKVIGDDDAGAEWVVDAAGEQTGVNALEAMCCGRDAELQRRR